MAVSERSALHTTRQFHLEVKQATMEDEWSISYLFRGFHGTSELLELGVPFGTMLGIHVLNEMRQSATTLPVVNIGDGVGINSRAILDVLSGNGLSSRFIGMDLSPMLLRSQALYAPERSSLQADAILLPFANRSISGVVNNEMIADLETVSVPQDELYTYWSYARHVFNNLGIPRAEWGYAQYQLLYKSLWEQFGNTSSYDPSIANALSIVFQYGLPLPGFDMHGSYNRTDAGINTGAIQFVEEIARVLAPDAWGIVTEYGFDTGDRWPTQADFGGHSEWSISFDHLRRVAESLGLSAKVVPLSSVIRPKMSAWCFVETMPDGKTIAMSVPEAMRFYPDVFADAKFSAPIRDAYFLDVSEDRELRELQSRGLNVQTVRVPRYSPVNDVGIPLGYIQSNHERILMKTESLFRGFYALLLHKHGKISQLSRR